MTDRKLAVWSVCATAAMLVAGGMIFLYAPADSLQGDVQRIFYLHVASALAAYACFALVLAGSVAYLWRRSSGADRLARCAAEVGLVFTTVVLVMGSLWAKPIWGTFWTWDARLTSTLVLWIIYAAYLLVRHSVRDRDAAARVAAWVGIIGFVDVPVVHLSVTWWRTLHPQAVLDNTNGPQLPAEMLVTFLVTALAVLLLASLLLALRYRLELVREGLEQALPRALPAGERSGAGTIPQLAPRER